MKDQIHEIIQDAQYKRITEHEALARLHAIGVSGEFEEDGRFVGYMPCYTTIESAYGMTIVGN